MQFFKLSLLLFGLLPFHDYHTSIMNFRYQPDEKRFKIDLTLDTEHFEHVLQNEFGSEVRITDFTVTQRTDSLIEVYVTKHISLAFNEKNVALKLDTLMVDYANITLKFKDISVRKKLKTIEMHNDLMFDIFPGQKNLVNYYYKGKAESMLFSFTETFSKIDI